MQSHFLTRQIGVAVDRKRAARHQDRYALALGGKICQLVHRLAANVFLEVKFARYCFDMLVAYFKLLLLIFSLLGQAILLREDQLIESCEGAYRRFDIG